MEIDDTGRAGLKSILVKKAVLFIVLGLAAGLVVYRVLAPKQEAMVGGDRDEHGCIGSAGYTWCEAKQKCLRLWEEPCISADDQDQEELIKTQIKTQIVEKHGPNAGNLTITVSRIEGDYAMGGASEKDMGGGMWFAAKAGDEWKLVWDGNGIITCNDLAAYPDFPATLIPDCFDESKNQMVTR